MAKRNFNGSQINQSVTIAEQAGAAINDVRNLILKYDENGDVVVATDGTAPIVGIAIIEAGYNDISGAESGKTRQQAPIPCLLHPDSLSSSATETVTRSLSSRTK